MFDVYVEPRNMSELGVEMKVQNTNSRSRKAIVGVMIAALGLAIVSPNLDGVWVWERTLFNMTAWLASEVWRSVILECCQAVPKCLCDDPGLLEGILQGVASHWPLLCVIVGGA